MRNLLVRFAHDQSGVTSIEYAFVACSIAVAIFVTLGMIGPKVRQMYSDASEGLK
jgi:Flp pilus assembly pilin Flp